VSPTAAFFLSALISIASLKMARSRSRSGCRSRQNVTASSEHAVRVMTFNMRLDTKNDADREGQDCRWAARRELFLQVILRELPDVLGVQEAMPWQVKDLTDSLEQAGYTCHGQARDGPDSEAMFIAIRPPWHIARTGCFWLAVDTPDIPGSIAPGARFPRLALWATLERADSGKKLLFLNTHLDHPTTQGAEGNRERSAEQIGRFIQREFPGWPAVVTLDANAEPGAPTHCKFLGMGLIDSWSECHPDKALERPTTFHLFQGTRFQVPPTWKDGCWSGSLGPDGRKTCHIDWILHTACLSATNCVIDHTEAADGRAPSDHFAVIATLNFGVSA
jgi:endonuclease/exonuclease/phosphatase family metal-dependent hydrolase